METLRHSVRSSSLLRCGGLVESRPDEARRGRDVAGNTKETAACPEGTQPKSAEHLGRSGTGIKIDIVVQVGKLPLESGGVGQHAEFVFIEYRFAVDYLQHQLAARSVRKAPVYGRSVGINSDHMHLSHCGLYLLYGRTTAQYPRHELQIGDAGGFLRGIERLITPVTGKIEQPCGESRFVQSFGHELLLLDRHTHIAVTCGKFHAVRTLRRIGMLGIPSGYDHIAAVQVTAAPLYRACHNVRTVLGLQCNARTGLRTLRPGCRRSGNHQHGYQFPFHNTVKYLVNICLVPETAPQSPALSLQICRRDGAAVRKKRTGTKKHPFIRLPNHGPHSNGGRPTGAPLSYT